MNILQDYTAGHRYLLEVIGRAAEFADPVTFTPGSLQWPLPKSAKKGDAIPIDGVLVRDASQTQELPSRPTSKNPLFTTG